MIEKYRKVLILFRLHHQQVLFPKNNFFSINKDLYKLLGVQFAFFLISVFYILYCRNIYNILYCKDVDMTKSNTCLSIDSLKYRITDIFTIFFPSALPILMTFTNIYFNYHISTKNISSNSTHHLD